MVVAFLLASKPLCRMVSRVLPSLALKVTTSWVSKLRPSGMWKVET